MSLARLAAFTRGLAVCSLAVPASGCSDIGARQEPIAAQVAGVVGGAPPDGAMSAGALALVDADTGQLLCSASLVSPSVALTAAHCLFDASRARREAATLSVVVGTLDLAVSSPENRLAVRATYVSPDYERNPPGDELANGLDPTEADLAVLVFDHDVIGMEPILIATDAFARDAVTPLMKMTITGYGINDAAAMTSGMLVTSVTTVEQVLANEFLAVPASEAEGDACGGDSGGPATATADGQTRLVGVASRARSDATAPCGQGGIWTSAAPFRAWVRSVSGDPRVAPDLGAHGGACTVVEGHDELGVPNAFAAATWVMAVGMLVRRRRSKPLGG